ncbi:hypothetical protein Ate02nite_87440 [Paractinoplanes tereljensis]|uniref:Streptomycin 6-kinase n=1 Tax=Paractinoplanes tereljensis TaxID=571912 RepID=A0A919TYB7_9ACTN|nr:hypothetical protein Ate02nite_87440 [Actinoplanes tereljensis]
MRAKARDAGAAAWLKNLPQLVGDLCRAWGLRPGVVFSDATEAYVVSVTRKDGTPAVLKLLMPRPGAAFAAFAAELAVLRLAAGEGCCRLYEYDVSRSALLLEHLGPAMSELNLPQPRRLAILTDLAAALWQRTDADLPTALTRLDWQIAYIRRKWTDLGEPCSRAAVDQALAAAESRRRAWNPDRAVLIHGDVHQWNALSVHGGPHPAVAHPAGHAAPGDGPSLLGCPARGADAHADAHGGCDDGGCDDGGCDYGGCDDGGCAGRSGRFRLVDPDGLIAEPEADLGVLMREDPVELLDGDPWDRARWLAARTGTDATAIWEWGLVERVATGLVLTVAGVQPVAAQMLAAADEISRRG